MEILFAPVLDLTIQILAVTGAVIVGGSIGYTFHKTAFRS